MTGIADQYALAIFSLAQESGNEEKYQALLQTFSEGMDDVAIRFFTHPKISKKDKKQVLETTVEDRLFLNFLKVLVDNDRIQYLHAISLAYRALIDEMNQVMNVEVISKTPLTKANIQRIKSKMKTTYHRKINIIETLDQTIVGGFKITFEGNVIDETINRQLEDIKSSLIE